MRVFVKILVFLFVSVFIIKMLYVNGIGFFPNTRVLVKPVFSDRDFSYWTKEEGQRYCTSYTDEDKNKLYSNLSSFADKKTTVVYFQNVDLLQCKDFIQTISQEFHKRGIDIAFNLEKTQDYKNIFEGNFEKLKKDYYFEMFKDFDFANKWVDYLVFDDASAYLTYPERREVQAQLRKVFPRPYLGFRFKKFENPSNSSHPLRPNKFFQEFQPGNDEGDFVITSDVLPPLNRTLIIAEDAEYDRTNIDGQFTN